MVGEPRESTASMVARALQHRTFLRFDCRGERIRDARGSAGDRCPRVGGDRLGWCVFLDSRAVSRLVEGPAPEPNKCRATSNTRLREMSCNPTTRNARRNACRLRDRTQPRMPRPAQGRVREGAPAEVTHSHVYQATLDLLAEMTSSETRRASSMGGRPGPRPSRISDRFTSSSSLWR